MQPLLPLTILPWALLPHLWLLPPSSCSILLPSPPPNSGVLNTHSLSLLIHNVNAHFHSQDSQIYGPSRTSLLTPDSYIQHDVSMRTSHRNLRSLGCSKVNFDLPCTSPPCFAQLGKWPLHPPSCSSQKRDSLVHACLPFSFASRPSPSPVNSTSKFSVKPADFSPSPVPRTGQNHLSPAHLQPPPNGPLCYPRSPVPLSTQQPECSCKIIRWSTSLLCLIPFSGFLLH